MKMKARRFLAFLLTAVMTFTLLAPVQADDLTAGETAPAATVESVTLPVSEKVELNSDAAGDSQWQIRAGDDLWVDISGADEPTLQLSYSMVANLLTDGTAAVRCKTTNGDQVTYGTEYQVMVDFDAVPQFEPAQQPDPATLVISEAQAVPQDTAETSAEDSGETEQVNESEVAILQAEEAMQAAEEALLAAEGVAASESAMTDEQLAALKEARANYEAAQAAYDEARAALSTVNSMVAPMMAAPNAAPQAEGDGEDVKESYTITIQYQYSTKGTQAAQPVIVELFEGTKAIPDGETSVYVSPEIMGYAPADDQKQIDLNDYLASKFPNGINRDDVITVNYYPAEVSYTVNYYCQNLDDDNYTLHEFQVQKGFTESPVGTVEGYEDKYGGFYALLYDTTTPIAADGSTVVEIYYDRYYYLMTFDLGGGYGVEPIYARYGAPIKVGTPTRPGYSFEQWNPMVPDTMPAYTDEQIDNRENVYTAQWAAGNATYLVQYWQENANDDNYSYVSSEERTANAGSVVSGRGDKSYTGFHFDHADQNVTVRGDGSSVVNVYYKRNTYTLTFQTYKRSSFVGGSWKTAASFNNVKYGEDTTQYWDQAPDGYLWYTTKYDTTFYTAAPDMPNANLTIYGRESGGSSTIHYYEHGTQNRIKADLHVAKSGWSFTKEDYVAIPGFTFHSSKGPSYKDRDYYIYYTRNSYELDFNNHGTIVKKYTVLYEDALSNYNFKPDYPAGREENAYTFAGWYSDPGFVNAVDWDSATMPYHNTVFYAKWIPVTHNVTFHLDDSMATKVGDTLTISHGEMIKSGVPTVEQLRKENKGQYANEGYTFVGWFYTDETGAEKAFDPKNMPVNRDLDLYAKWSSNVLKPYVIRYFTYDKDGSKVYIAADTTGSALAGTTKTFEAKSGGQLYADYQEGYFPLTPSHSLTIDINDRNEDPTINVFEFEYVPREFVAYTVHYVGEDGKTVHGTKYATSPNVVVNETYVYVAGMMPDEAQKRLVLQAAPEDVEDKTTWEQKHNVITFVYREDPDHAPVIVEHWFQNINDENKYTLYDQYTESYVDKLIGENVTANILPENAEEGFAFGHATAQHGSADPVPAESQNDKVTAQLTNKGLVLRLYYDRIKYPYEIRYLEQSTNTVLHEPTQGTARFGTQVRPSEKEKLDITGYRLVNTDPAYIIIQNGATPDKNVITLYYVKSTAPLTITKTIKDPNYDGAPFLFRITNDDGFSMDVLVPGNGSVTINDLQVGETYTVTEDESWAWRYNVSGDSSVRIEASGSTVKFTNTIDNDKWFDHTTSAENQWSNGKVSQVAKSENE